MAWIADELGAEILKVPVASEWGIIGNLAGQDFPHLLPYYKCRYYKSADHRVSKPAIYPLKSYADVANKPALIIGKRMRKMWLGLLMNWVRRY